MHLAALTNDSLNYLSGIQHRSLLLVHLLYLGAVTLLHRRLLVHVAEMRLLGSGLVPLTDEIKGYHDYCLLTSQQAARVAKIIMEDGTLPKQCWVAVYQTFSASCILLFFIAQKLLHRNHDRLDDDFAYADNCIELLEWCSSIETLAARYISIVRPLFDQLKTLYVQGSVMLVSPGSPTLVREDVLPLAKQVNRVLIDPYGAVQMSEMATAAAAVTLGSPTVSAANLIGTTTSRTRHSPGPVNWWADPMGPLLRPRDMAG
jgi:hypothetical protein